MSDSDMEKIIRSAAQGDEKAFEQLVKAYQKLVFHTVKSKLKNDEDALDASQEVFIKIWKALPNFRFECKFTTWVYRIAINTALDKLRKSNPETPQSTLEDEERVLQFEDETTNHRPEEALERKEKCDAIRKAIDSLNGDLREIIILRDINGLSYEEIADVLSIELGTVKSRLNRAREKLKRNLIADGML